MLRRIRNLKQVYTRWGYKGISKYFVEGVTKKMQKNSKQSVSQPQSPKYHPYQEFGFINEKKLELRERETKDVNKTISWVIPDVGYASGGHFTLFRIIKYFQCNGFVNNIHIFRGSWHKNAAALKAYVSTNYLLLDKCNFYLDDKKIYKSDIYFATSWQTAYTLQKINEGVKMYLVQDFEPYFYPLSSQYHFAEETYKMGFHHLCASNWLADKLNTDYQAKVSHFTLGYDEKIYKHKNNNREPRTVVAYLRKYTERRGFELAILALQKLYKDIPDVKIILFGDDLNNVEFPFPCQTLGILTPDQLANLYNSATVGLSLSLSNVSLVPFEMMACGLPVVETNHPSVSTTFPAHILLQADMSPFSISSSLASLLMDAEKRLLVSEMASSYAKENFTWEKSLNNIKNIVLTAI